MKLPRRKFLHLAAGAAAIRLKRASGGVAGERSEPATELRRSLPSSGSPISRPRSRTRGRSATSGKRLRPGSRCPLRNRARHGRKRPGSASSAGDGRPG